MGTVPASTPEPCEDPLAGLPLCALVGPTAVGKSSLAQALCEEVGVELFSLDSMLVYRGMDVGTAKPGASEQALVPHRLIDLVDPPQRYDVTRYLRDVRAAALQLAARGARALFVGGSAFYLKALLEGLFEGPPVDPVLRNALEERARERGNAELFGRLEEIDPRSAARIHVNDTKRLVRALEVFEQTGRTLSDWQREWGWYGERRPARVQHLVGLELPVEELDERIARRTAAMLDAGWAEEARAIRDGGGFGPTSIQALGYREVLEHLDGRLERAECAQRIRLRTRQFARRQRTWYRKFDEIEWRRPPVGDPSSAELRELARCFGW